MPIAERHRSVWREGVGARDPYDDEIVACGFVLFELEGHGGLAMRRTSSGNPQPNPPALPGRVVCARLAVAPLQVYRDEVTYFGSRCLRSSAFVVLTCMGAFAHAETPGAASAAADSAGTTPAPTATAAPDAAAKADAPAAPVRRDPNGRTGISPMMEAVVRGDAAFLARDFVAAASAYQEAIKAAPQKAVGHLRMAALHLAQGELDQASVVLAAAERFTGGDATLTVQTLALKAMVQEARAALS